MFDFFKKKKISIWPNKASDSVASLALLIDSLGFPFTGWKHPDLEMSEYYTDVIKFACNSNQVFTYRYLFDDNLVGEVMLGCALAVARDEREELVKTLEFGIFTLETIMKLTTSDAINSDNPLNVLFSRFAELWETTMCDKDNKAEEEREALRKVLYECLIHSRSQAINAFNPMIESIKIYDLEEIEQLTYRKERGLYEEVLFKRSTHPKLFKFMPIPNAQLLLEARRKEYQTAIKAESTQQSCLIKLRDDMKEYGRDTRMLYDKFCEFLALMDDIRLELHVIGGEHCKLKLDEITYTRNDYFDKVTKIFVSFEETFEPVMESLRTNYDSTYDQMSNEKMTALKYIDTKEIPSYVLTLPDEVFIAVKEFVSRDEMNKHLFDHCPELMLGIVTEDEDSKEIYRKVELLA
jgi:hypothetical protein